jgi:hypothetical protein
MVALRPLPRSLPGDAMTRRPLSLLLSAGLLAAAFATSAQTVSVTADATVQAQAANAGAAAAFSPAAKPEIDRYCLRQTGSWVIARDNAVRERLAGASDRKGRRCVAASGRVYSREDIDRTGEIDIADALRKLDPSIH